ncbi:putative outer membrane protein [Arcticibacter svalbardensis MN12-7]|uniref:Putative outer membrane protein n=1 Tax=Arcticibacter svalbardensis MN12-7 TaxID=1150600 RepID=R9GZ32_9SPHI|nr:putative outer membrane protein [Arcticibacter svalbardensis MN12-7]
MFLSLFSSACNDEILDIQPTDQLTDATVWSNAANAGLFLNDIYNSLNPGPQSTVFTNLPSEISNDPLDNFSDNSIGGSLAGIPSYVNFASGSYGPSTPIFPGHWDSMYKAIRKCNVFIENVSPADYDANVKKSYIAQARFLRAYFYKQLMNLYGGVPIITKSLNQSEDGESIFQARNSYEECVAFLQTECEEAATDLPLKVTAAEAGRVTKGAALALKGEAELYASKWEDAAATNLKIINLGAGYDLFADYAGLFYVANENNKEVIFDIQYAANVKPEVKEGYWNPVKTTDGTSFGSVNPTQDMVDTYEFLDGKTEAEGSALFDPSNPYANRDKRFAASIIYDGATWKGGVINTRLGIANNRNQLDESGSGGGTRTGYWLGKIIDPSIVPRVSAGQNSIIWRYADVLLNYAEAKNENTGPDQSIYDAINKLRTRGGLPNLTTGLTQDQMREKIRRERRVELFFEGKRLFDLWRWRIAEDVFSKPLSAMKITVVAGKLVYQKQPAGGAKVTFDKSKNYLMPIPAAVIAQNPKITQNPGY